MNLPENFFTKLTETLDELKIEDTLPEEKPH